MIIVSTSLRDVAGLVRSSEKNTSTLCPLIPPAALVALAHALYVASSPTKLEAYAPVQLQINPTFMGDAAEEEVCPQPDIRDADHENAQHRDKEQYFTNHAVSPLNLDH